MIWWRNHWSERIFKPMPCLWWVTGTCTLAIVSILLWENSVSGVYVRWRAQLLSFIIHDYLYYTEIIQIYLSPSSVSLPLSFFSSLSPSISSLSLSLATSSDWRMTTSFCRPYHIPEYIDLCTMVVSCVLWGCVTFKPVQVALCFLLQMSTELCGCWK